MSDFPINTKYSYVESPGNAVEGSNQFSVFSGATQTKGAWRQIIASTAREYHALQLINTRRTNNGHLIDWAIGGAGSEQIIIENLMNGESRPNAGGTRILWPQYIPKGTRISCRCQHIVAATPAWVSGIGYVGTFETDGIVSKSATYGADTSLSRGTPIDAGGVFNVYGAWTEITASTDFHHRYLLIQEALPSSTVHLNLRFGLDVGIGGAGSEEIIIEAYNTNSQSQERGTMGGYYAFPVDIPEGTRIAVRSIAGGTANVIRDVILTGFA